MSGTTDLIDYNVLRLASMNTSAIHLAIGFFILLVVGMGVYTYLEKAAQQQSSAPVVDTTDDVGNEPATDTSPVSEPVPEPPPSPAVPADMSPVSDSTEMLTITRAYSDGTHTITGEVMKPTPCHELTYDVMVAESYPEQVTIAFTTMSSAEMCAQVITAEPFTISLEVAEAASFVITVNGKVQMLSL